MAKVLRRDEWVDEWLSWRWPYLLLEQGARLRGPHAHEVGRGHTAADVDAGLRVRRIRVHGRAIDATRTCLVTIVRGRVLARAGRRSRMRSDGSGIVTVASHGRAHIDVVKVFASEQHAARLWLRPLEEVELLVPMTAVEDDHGEGKDEEREYTYHGAGDDTLVGCGRHPTRIVLAERRDNGLQGLRGICQRHVAREAAENAPL